MQSGAVCAIAPTQGIVSIHGVPLGTPGGDGANIEAGGLVAGIPKEGAMKVNLDFEEGITPFYFFRTKERAWVFAGLYESSKDAVRAAYDVNRLTGQFTCMVSRQLPKLVWVRKTSLKVQRKNPGPWEDGEFSGAT
jgi:hypothetical protein